MTFDAEVRTSLRAITVEAQKTKTTVDGTNQSLRQTATTLSTVAAKHREVSQAAVQHAGSTSNLASQVGKVGQAAQAAGGAAGGMVARMGGLVGLSPQAAILGAAIGFVSSKLADVVANAKKGREELAGLLALQGDARDALAKAGSAALLGDDPAAGARRQFEMGSSASPYNGIPEGERKAVAQLAAQALGAGLVQTVDEFVARVAESGLFSGSRGVISQRSPEQRRTAIAAVGIGQPDADPAEINYRLNRVQYTNEGITQQASIRARQEKADRDRIQRQGVAAIGAGVAPPSGFDPVAAARAASPDVENKFKSWEDSIRENTKAQEALKDEMSKGGWRSDINVPMLGIRSSSQKVADLDTTINAARANIVLYQQSIMSGYR